METSIPKKILLLVIDGVSDRPVNGETPLKVAVTPNLDELAKRGVNGMMNAIGPGIRPGSATAHLAILGYDPYEAYTGRGPFEAIGIGIEVQPGDIAFRCNFGTVDENNVILDRRAGRIRETDELEKAINEQVELDGADFIFKRSTGHRAALVLRGEGLSADVTDNDPHHENVSMLGAKATSVDGEKTAQIMSSFISQSHKVLGEHPLNKKRVAEGEHPANMIFFRGGGVVPDLEPFQDKYGLRSAVIAAAGLIIGIGKMLGMTHIPVEGVTGGVDSNIENKISAMLETFDEYDFILLNIKGADEAGHDGDFQSKANFLGRVDEALAPLLELKDTLLVVTGDHSTPICVRDHSGDPVPIIIAGEGVRTDDVGTYDEFSAAQGGLGRIRGLDLMPILTDLIDRTEIFGA